ncbi:hypothetical protein EU245_11085 [Lentibacillus lipolyticus]|nr:hypothetical protein EU245_11085 [Lentibacillus lipolyticus]
MNSKAKNSWISYLALVSSILPVPFFLALLYNINWTDFITMPLITTIIIIAFIFSVTGLIKKTESNIISSIAVVITLGSGLFVGLIVFVSGMGQPA